MKKILAFSILALAVLAAHGQTAAFNGYCTQGGVSAQTSGLPSTNKLQGIIPQCDVEVFLTGTTTLATIYLDSSSTPLTNPFTADTLGKWLFYAATGQGYDVVMSGGFPPLVYPNPVTLTDLIIGGGGGCDCDFSGVHNTNTFIIDDVTNQPGEVPIDGIQLNETGTSGIEISTTTGGISLDSGGGISLSDSSTNNIDIDESLPGANIGISADNLYFASATPAQAQLNSSQICTMATGCGGGSSGVSSLNLLTGALNISCGSGLTCTAAGSTIAINLATGFTINSFTGCGGALELGQTVTDPVCSATYSGTPTSASITNTDSIDSPLVLSSPFTSGTIVGSFHHTTIATTSILLTAIGSSTQTANQTYTWNPRIFSGLGTSGATSSVTASGTTAILSNANVIPSAGLGAETVGQTFGPYAPSGQAVYLLLTGGSHTFTDVCSGFPFAFNAPLTVTFVNEFGATVNMYLYQSTNSLTGSCFEPRVIS